MVLVKVEDFYPTYREDYSDFGDIKGFDVYAEGHEKVGSVSDILVDEDTGRLRYFVVDTGFWIFGKKVLLPVGRASVDYDDKEVNVPDMARWQVERLPNFDDLEKVDYDYEEQVRGIYRPMAVTPGITQDSVAYDRNTYNYEQEPSLYNIGDKDNQTLKLYEERLVANKQRRKAGEVSIGKHVETETTHVAVPVEKERVVIERTNPYSTTSNIPSTAFQEGEFARMDIYEETPDIHKEAVVKEEVRVKKVIDRDIVEGQETLRREELDVDADGRPIDERRL